MFINSFDLYFTGVKSFFHCRLPVVFFYDSFDNLFLCRQLLIITHFIYIVVD
jgi:hypothetical protein